MEYIRNKGLYRPRWLQKLYADICGWLWLSCPICGREFGGHERGRWGYATTPVSQVAVCPYCVDKAAEYDRRSG